MGQKETIKDNQKEQHGPPMPKFLVNLVNPLLKLMLTSPLHGGMSRRLMVISFTGRKTGKRYATPVGYVQRENEIFVFTHSAWWNNFQKPAPVQMRIRGINIQGTARLVTDPARIKQMIQTLTAANGEEMARRMGFWVEDLDKANPEKVRQATAGTYFIEIKTQDGP